jgi:hypothetical protein
MHGRGGGKVCRQPENMHKLEAKEGLVTGYWLLYVINKRANKLIFLYFIKQGSAD